MVATNTGRIERPGARTPRRDNKGDPIERHRAEKQNREWRRPQPEKPQAMNPNEQTPGLPEKQTEWSRLTPFELCAHGARMAVEIAPEKQPGEGKKKELQPARKNPNRLDNNPLQPLTLGQAAAGQTPRQTRKENPEQDSDCLKNRTFETALKKLEPRRKHNADHATAANCPQT